MTMHPELLLITWNRSQYLEKMLANLLADPADFRVYWWDNASEDERTRELFETTNDERIVWKHRHEENVGQREPCLWFLENAESDIVGKIDDDILLPRGWTDRIAPMLRAEPRFGMLGCWIFMESDWDAEAAKRNTVETAAGPVLRMTGLAGHSFLMRKGVARQYSIADSKGHGIPVDRPQMSMDGLISGIPLPPSFAHNMDDPRSPHCLMSTGNGEMSALTARSLHFTSKDEYAKWIAKDASRRLRVPYDKQMQHLRIRRMKGIRGRIGRRFLRMAESWSGA